MVLMQYKKKKKQIHICREREMGIIAYIYIYINILTNGSAGNGLPELGGRFRGRQKGNELKATVDDEEVMMVVIYI